MKVCLAGSFNKEVMAYVSTLPNNSLSILQTFFDYRKSTPNGRKRFETLVEKSNHFMLDSGAFSMIYGGKRVEVKEYVDDYIEFIREYDIKNYIELDLYNVIGVKETEDIRHRIEDAIGRPSIPVFHKSLGKDYFLKMTEDYDYIAVGGIAVAGRGGYNVSLFHKLNKLAADNGCRVHGLGYTTVKNLGRTGFYSVDSTSWLAPLRYGAMLHAYHNGEMKKINVPDGKRIISMAVGTYQLKEWLKFQDYAERRF